MNQREHYHHGDLRQVLMKEALRVLEQQGEVGLSLRAIAKTAGVSPNAPYRHFADRDELLAALSAEGFTAFADALNGACDPALPAIKALEDMGVAYIEFAVANPALYRLMFSPLGYSLHSEVCQRESGRAFGLLIAAGHRAQAEGSWPAVPLETPLLGFWSHLHGNASLRIDRLVPPEFPLPPIAETVAFYLRSPHQLPKENP